MTSFVTGLLEIVLASGLGTSKWQEKDWQVWDGKISPHLGKKSQILGRGAEAQAGHCRLNSCLLLAESIPQGTASLHILLDIILCSNA